MKLLAKFMKQITLTEEEMEVVRISLKSYEPNFYNGCNGIQTALMGAAFQNLLSKFSPNVTESKPGKGLTKRGRPRKRKPKSIEPLNMNEFHDTTENFFDCLRNEGLIPTKIFNPCAGTNQGVLTHFLKRRTENFTLILNEEKNIISIPVDSDFCPTLEPEWETWRDKHYLDDWVVFEPLIQEAFEIMQLAISYSLNVAVLLPIEYSNPKMCPAELWSFLQEQKPDCQILNEDSVWLVWSEHRQLTT